MKKRMILMLVVIGIVLGLVFGYKAFGRMMMMKFMAAGANPPQTVSAIKAEIQEWQPELRAVGTIRAVNGADLTAEVTGIVDKIIFESGDLAKAGDVIIQLRADDERAQLESARANARLADITYQRDLRQLKAQAVSQAALDASQANLAIARAQVAEREAMLNKKIVKAPFNGLVGIRRVDIGQYLNPGAIIASLQQLDPLYVDFYLPQGQLQEVKLGQTVTVRTDAFDQETFSGTITAINARVETETRNILVRATLQNPDKKLLPGMFANVSIAAGEAQRHLTLPQTAITFNPYGNSVYVVSEQQAEGQDKPELQAKQTFVITGDSRGDQVAVLSGIKEGDLVVTAGQIKLRPGSPIIINNEVHPTNDPAPQPKDGH
jgi:membrane fusion protein (multidrug efflux system)